MADALFLWMKKSGVMAALQSLFSTTSLRLSAVLLADYGDGFVRHGAWARWINKTFQLYPGLSSAVVRPPLPSVVAGCPKVKASTFPAKASPFWRWLPVSLALLIAFYLTSAAWLQSQHIKEARLALAAFTQADVIRPETRREAFERLSRQGQKLSGTCKNSLINLWGEKNCQNMLDKIETALRHYKSLPALFASVPAALFAPGSAVIQPGSEEKLLMLLPLLSSARQTTFMVTGHSDNTGTDQLNRQISIQRATAVRDWLVRHTRLPAENFIIKGMGDAVPVASNETEAGRRKNRRVELIPLSQ
ncbi:OmpA family protein [Erwinia sp. BNK-24-b]